jgi:hypothetical protein
VTTPETDASARDNEAGESTTDESQLSADDLRAALQKERDKAARYRKQAKFSFGDEESFKRAKEAVTALEKIEQEKKSEVERLSEDREKLLFQASESERNLLRLRAALTAGVESSQIDEFAARLQGSTEDELKADAEKLAKFFTPARRGDRSQGAGADSTPVDDPIQLALMNKLGIAT